MDNKPNNQRILLISAIALLVAFLLVVFYIVPKLTDLKSSSDRLAAKQQELAVGRDKVTAIKTALQVISKAKSDVERLGIAIPTSENAPEALVQIQNAAAQSGATVKSVSIGQSEKGYQNISVTIVAKFEGVTGFMEKLSSSVRPVKFVDFSFGTSQSSSDISATFNIGFPFIADTSKAAAATSPTAATTEKTDLGLTGATQ